MLLVGRNATVRPTYLCADIHRGSIDKVQKLDVEVGQLRVVRCSSTKQVFVL